MKPSPIHTRHQQMRLRRQAHATLCGEAAPAASSSEPASPPPATPREPTRAHQFTLPGVVLCIALVALALVGCAVDVVSASSASSAASSSSSASGAGGDDAGAPCSSYEPPGPAPFCVTLMHGDKPHGAACASPPDPAHCIDLGMTSASGEALYCCDEAP